MHRRCHPRRCSAAAGVPQVLGDPRRLHRQPGLPGDPRRPPPVRGVGRDRAGGRGPAPGLGGAARRPGGPRRARRPARSSWTCRAAGPGRPARVRARLVLLAGAPAPLASRCTAWRRSGRRDVLALVLMQARQEEELAARGRGDFLTDLAEGRDRRGGRARRRPGCSASGPGRPAAAGGDAADPRAVPSGNWSLLARAVLEELASVGVPVLLGVRPVEGRVPLLLGLRSEGDRHGGRGPGGRGAAAAAMHARPTRRPAGPRSTPAWPSCPASRARRAGRRARAAARRGDGGPPRRAWTPAPLASGARSPVPCGLTAVRTLSRPRAPWPAAPRRGRGPSRSPPGPRASGTAPVPGPRPPGQ
ncbi:hypothetical protein SCALM49S_10362 [Streptomyces californicus]